MTDFSNSPGNGAGKAPNSGFHDLKAPRSQEAVAFLRSAIGEEVLPGVFIVNKTAALVVSALRIHTDLIFREREIELLERARATGSISRKAIVQAASELLSRMADKVDTKRGVFLVGKNPTVQTSVLETALSDLPEFSARAAYIKDAIRYLAQPDNIFVTEGAGFAKSDLLLLILGRYCISRPMEGMNLMWTYEFVRSVLERTPEIGARLEREGIVPSRTAQTNPLRFWSEVFSSSQCKSNETLLDFIRSKMEWPEGWKDLPNNGVFLSGVICKWIYAQGLVDANSPVFDRLRATTTTCDRLARIVEEVYSASRARIARSN